MILCMWDNTKYREIFKVFNNKNYLPSIPLILFFARYVAYCGIIFKLRDLLNKYWSLLFNLISSL